MTYTEHMIEHLVLAQLVPLLLAVVASGRLDWRPRALVAWITGVVVLIATSLPPAYHLVEHDALVNWIVRVVLVIAGFVFWIAVLDGGKTGRIGPAAALGYLIGACFATTLAGVFIAFSATTADQQVAGLIMWVPCCVIYLGASVTVVVRALRPRAAH